MSKVLVQRIVRNKRGRRVYTPMVTIETRTRPTRKELPPFQMIGQGGLRTKERSGRGK